MTPKRNEAERCRWGPDHTRLSHLLEQRCERPIRWCHLRTRPRPATLACRGRVAPRRRDRRRRTAAASSAIGFPARRRRRRGAVAVAGIGRRSAREVEPEHRLLHPRHVVCGRTGQRSESPHARLSATPARDPKQPNSQTAPLLDCPTRGKRTAGSTAGSGGSD
eukprot:362239-Chlamydomonas_euryale.AAC.5